MKFEQNCFQQLSKICKFKKSNPINIMLLWKTFYSEFSIQEHYTYGHRRGS